MGKRKDPPKGAGGRAHLELPALSMSGGDSSQGAGGRANLVLAPLTMSGGDLSTGTGAQLDAPSRAAQITVGAAQRTVGAAHEVLSGLPIPNDLSEAHLDLFLEFRRTVEDFKRNLAEVTDQNKLMSGEIDVLRKAQKALPVWRATWLTFIASTAGVAAGTVGASAASYAAGYTAGFIAGVLHDTFSPDSLCIMT